MKTTVTAVSSSATHSFRKQNTQKIELVVGLGVEGDAHSGAKVQHRSRVRQNPDEANLRQVHLIQSELHQELRAIGFVASAGDMGENITTAGLDLLGLPEGTRLHIGPEAVIELTGPRNPCLQLDRFQSGLMAAVLEKQADGTLIRKAGVMSIVISGGPVRVGDVIDVELPKAPHRALQPV